MVFSDVLIQSLQAAFVERKFSQQSALHRGGLTDTFRICVSHPAPTGSTRMYKER